MPHNISSGSKKGNQVGNYGEKKTRKTTQPERGKFIRFCTVIVGNMAMSEVYGKFYGKRLHKIMLQYVSEK
jgi:hypothetical protein